MRIGFATHEEEGWGGIGTYTAILSRALARAGHDVHVAVRSWDEETTEETAGVIVHRLTVPEPAWRRGTQAIVSRLYMTRDALIWSARARKTLTGQRVELIEAPEYRAQGLLAAIAPSGAGVVARLHSSASLIAPINAATDESRWDRLIGARLERTFANRASLITAPSRALAEARALPSRRVRIVPNPIDLDRFADATGERQQHRIICVARLERVKGVDTLIDAFKTVRDNFPDARLELIGEDDAEGWYGTSVAAHLHARLAELGVPADTVEFHGAIARSELPAAYARASVCVIPSRWEGFPYVCLEAMASGCAVVASTAGGIPEIVTDGIDGLLCPPGDSQALGRTLLRVLENAEFCRRLASRGLRTVTERFDAPRVAAETASLYAELLSRGSR